MLGASRWRAFREVTLPALRPAIAAAAAIVFLFTFTSFGVILILGGPRYATLETEIYRQTAQLLNLPLAAALTIVQLVAVVRAARRRPGGSKAGAAVALRLRAARRDRAPPAHRRRARSLVGANLAVMAVLLGGADRRARRAVAPHARRATASTSTARSASVHAGSTLFVPPLDAIANSLRFAAIATRASRSSSAAARAFALASTRRRGLDTLVVAAARRVGGHRRLRVPHRARPPAARPPRRRRG